MGRAGEAMHFVASWISGGVATSGFYCYYRCNFPSPPPPWPLELWVAAGRMGTSKRRGRVFAASRSKCDRSVLVGMRMLKRVVVEIGVLACPERWV